MQNKFISENNFLKFKVFRNIVFVILLTCFPSTLFLAGCKSPSPSPVKPTEIPQSEKVLKQEKTVVYLSDGNISEYYIEEYNTSGKLTNRSIYEESGTLKEFMNYEYENGELVSLEVHDYSAGNIYYYEYDYEYYSDGKTLKQKIEREYDDENNLKRTYTQNYNTKGKIVSYVWDTGSRTYTYDLDEVTLLREDSSSGQYITYNYENSKLKNKLYYSDPIDNELLARDDYIYDSNGNLIEESYSNVDPDGNAEALFTVKYGYNSTHKLVSQEEYDPDNNLTMKRICSYDAYGNLISERNDYYDPVTNELNEYTTVEYTYY